MSHSKILVTGCNGQLGRAVRSYAERFEFDGIEYSDIDTFDLSNPNHYNRYNWPDYAAVINCGAYTAVDRAETFDGRPLCWAANATGPALMSRTCSSHGIILVHVSSDYVFDGTREVYSEDDALAPLSVYGQSKAAGDLAVRCCPSHYILRSSWVIGDGNNFVKTMRVLSNRVADHNNSLDRITVVNDQFGRLTFTDEMARCIFHLLGFRDDRSWSVESAPFGTYNFTGSGSVRTWFDIARIVFDRANGNSNCVAPVSTADYFASARGPIAPRPMHSTLDLSKIASTGFIPRDWEEELEEYLDTLTI